MTHLLSRYPQAFIKPVSENSPFHYFISQILESDQKMYKCHARHEPCLSTCKALSSRRKGNSLAKPQEAGFVVTFDSVPPPTPMGSMRSSLLTWIY
jgi:hypothetical protein